jgi:GNAT superfamily N-acetyltransferase
MNNQIINNLYEFWKHIGKLSNTLIETELYSAVSMDNSDWPNRIFDFKQDYDSIEKIKKLSKNNQLPSIVTFTKPHRLTKASDLEFVFGQKNMAFKLDLFSDKSVPNPKIKRVKTEKEAIAFANTASKSFGYYVDQQVIFEIVKKSKTVRLFTYDEGVECLACGMVFFDSNNNAGLHMIGTLPKVRGKGIGKSMTEKLLTEAKESFATICVLNASLMGEPIYARLGFKSYGEIETYRIIK